MQKKKAWLTCTDLCKCSESDDACKNSDTAKSSKMKVMTSPALKIKMMTSHTLKIKMMTSLALKMKLMTSHTLKIKMKMMHDDDDTS